MSNRFIQIQIDVAYGQASATQLNDLVASIYQSLGREIGNGMLNDGAPEVEVQSYQISVQAVDAQTPVDEAEYPLKEEIE